MYLEMLKGKDILLHISKNSCNVEDMEDFLWSRLFTLSEMAKLFEVKSARYLDVFNDYKTKYEGNIKDKMVIDYIDGDYFDGKISEFICQHAQLVIRVFWDDCNNALVIEEIWYKGEKVGLMEYSKDGRSVEPNDILKEEEFGYIDVKYKNYDFTLDKDINIFYKLEDGDLTRIDRPKYPYGKFVCGKIK